MAMSTSPVEATEAPGAPPWEGAVWDAEEGMWLRAEVAPDPPSTKARHAGRQGTRREYSAWLTTLAKHGGYGGTPNIAALIPFMSGPVAKGYLVAVLRADRYTGKVELAGSYMAAKLGIKDRRLGARIVQRLADAGLMKRVIRGMGRQPSVYQLVPAALVDIERAKAALSRPLRKDVDRGSQPPQGHRSGG